MLDQLTLTGEVSWARLNSGVALFLRDHAAAWEFGAPVSSPALSQKATELLDHLRIRGASFFKTADYDALRELAGAGLVTSDGFAGARMLISRRSTRPELAGRWSLVHNSSPDIELQAKILLKRYGVIFRRLLTREWNAAPWRDLARVYAQRIGKLDEVGLADLASSTHAARPHFPD